MKPRLNCIDITCMCFCFFYSPGFQQSHLQSRFPFEESGFPSPWILAVSALTYYLKTPCVRISARHKSTFKLGDVSATYKGVAGAGNHKRERNTLGLVTVWRRELLSKYGGKEGNVEMFVCQELWQLIESSSFWQFSREAARGINILTSFYRLKLHRLIEAKGQRHMAGWEK